MTAPQTLAAALQRLNALDAALSSLLVEIDAVRDQCPTRVLTGADAAREIRDVVQNLRG